MSVMSNSVTLWTPLGSSVRGILQAGILEWVACPPPEDLSNPRIEPIVSYVSWIGRQVLYHYHHYELPIVQFSSVQWLSRVQLCDPMNRSTPSLLVHHQLPEFTQTHVHRVGDAIQPSHPLWSPSPPAPNPSQHQSLFK